MSYHKPQRHDVLLSLHRRTSLCWINRTAGHRHRPQHLLIPESLQRLYSQTHGASFHAAVSECVCVRYLDNVVRKTRPAALQDSSSDLHQGFPQEKLRYELRRVIRTPHVSQAKHQQANEIHRQTHTEIDLWIHILFLIPG